MAAHSQSSSRSEHDQCFVLEADDSVNIRTAQSSISLKNLNSQQRQHGLYIVTNPKVKTLHLQIHRNGGINTNTYYGNNTHGNQGTNSQFQRAVNTEQNGVDDFNQCQNKNDAGTSQYAVEDFNQYQNKNDAGTNQYGTSKIKCRKKANTADGFSTNQYAANDLNPCQRKNSQLRRMPSTSSKSCSCLDCHQRGRNLQIDNGALRRPKFEKGCSKSPNKSTLDENLDRQCETDNSTILQHKFELEFEKLFRISMNIEKEQEQVVSKRSTCNFSRGTGKGCPSLKSSQDLRDFLSKSPSEVERECSHWISNFPQNQINKCPANPHAQSLYNQGHVFSETPCNQTERQYSKYPQNSQNQRNDFCPNSFSKSPHYQIEGNCSHCSSNPPISETEITLHVGPKELSDLMNLLSKNKTGDNFENSVSTESGTTLFVNAKALPDMLNLLSRNNTGQNEENAGASTQLFVRREELPKLINLLAKNKAAPPDEVKSGAEDGGKEKKVHFHSEPK